MTKQELIRKVAKESSTTIGTAELAVNAVRDAIVNEVKGNGRFALDGVGVFTLGTRAARTGRNPQTGDPVQIPEKKVVKFRPANGFKKAVEVV